MSPALAGRFFTTAPPGKPYELHEKKSKVKTLVTQSRLILCNPVDYSLPGSFVYGILQSRILEWVDISFPRGSDRFFIF